VRDGCWRLSPRQRQYALLAAHPGGGIGLLWLIFAASPASNPQPHGRAVRAMPGDVTNIGVLPPGGQVNPVDQWVGTAGRKLAQYETEREEQGRLNKDRQAFEARTMQRFAELEQRLTSSAAGGRVATDPGPARRHRRSRCADGPTARRPDGRCHPRPSLPPAAAPASGWVRCQPDRPGAAAAPPRRRRP
jgi:conjugal transfer pilus assembly protein TraB